MVIAGLLCAILSVVTIKTAFANGNQATAATETAPDALSNTERVSAMLAALDIENPNADAVREARAAYEALSMAQKMRVEGLERLTAAEAALSEEAKETTTPTETVPVNTQDPDRVTQKSGTQYSFRINQYLCQLTLTIRYQTDEDNDGRMDPPSITLISPTGKEFEIRDKTSVKGDGLDIDVMHTPSFTQVDVTQATDGTWEVKTSNKVLFVLSDYAGVKPSESFAEVTTNESESAQSTENDNGNNNGAMKGVLLLVGFIAFVIVLFVMMKKLPQMTEKKQTKAKEDKAKKEAEIEEREAKEMADFLMEWKKMNQEYDDDPEDEPVNKKKKNDQVEDERLMETVRDDEGLEIIPDHDPFAKSRF